MRHRYSQKNLLIACLFALIATGPALGAGRQVQVQTKPTFQVAPLLHRFESSPGATIDFAFEVRSPGSARVLKIEPIAMAQEESGQLSPTPGSASESGPDVIRLISPGQMELEPDRPQQIRGRITVPNSGSSFQPYGLLVTDLGPPETAAAGKDEQEQTSLNVRFVTRYLLRIELVVRGVRSETAAQLELSQGSLTEVNGRAIAGALVTNPTGTPFEFEGQCRIIQSNGKPLGPPFKLSMPIRSNPGDSGRFRSRVLGASRVRVVAPLPDPIVPGEYEMLVELLVDGRRAVTQRFPITVTAEQFPAQAAVIAQIVKDVNVSPTQLELSLRPRGSRMVPLKVTNTSNRPVMVKLQCPESAVDWLVVRPDTLTLAAGATRSAMISLRNAQAVESHCYAALRVEVVPQDGGVGGALDLPVALVTRAPAVVRLDAEPIQWDVSQRAASFAIPVHNGGSIHIPLDAKLTLTDAFGRNLELAGGFGRWLMPGESSMLRFPLGAPLPPGEYTIRGQLHAGEDNDPIRFKERMVVGLDTLSRANDGN